MSVERFKSMVKRLESQVGQPYAMGFDSAVNGSNTTNCDFRIFSTPERTRQWEKGKEAGAAFLADRAGSNSGSKHV